MGGVEIPHDRHLVGHSDADVLLHAVTDALLGAVNEGDIGELFPDTDPAHRGRDSAQMLAIAHDLVAAAGYQVGNLDCVVHAQRPKLATHRLTIRRRIAQIMSLHVDHIGLKAKTGEGIGVIGEERAIAARCVVLLKRAKQ